GLNLALAQDAGAQAWDGQWHLTAISTPESDRRRRDAARRSLLSAGAAPASTGLYVSPHDLTELLPDDLNSHIVTAASSTLSLRGMTDPLEITEHLWPAAPVVAPYGALADALDADTTSETPTTRKLRLADALDRALRDDPLIPAELRQTPWRPAQIRRSWRDRWHSIPDSHPTLFDGWFADTLAR
ncbi:MAG: PaaX family transcriptional regulator, partial [Mycetocola sp.]